MAMPRDYMIETHGLTKVFEVRKTEVGETRWLGRFRHETEQLIAVNKLNLKIGAGELFGLLGPNGAGKTTTIKMLCTLIEPTSGTATINGLDILKDADKVRENIGAILEGERALYWKLTARENLEFFAKIYHVPSKIAKGRIKELLELVELSDRADDTVEKFSKGMKQRLTIAKALIHNAPVLLLDEPTLGLDPKAARQIREVIRGLCEKGHTVILTTHYMEEADQLCDRVGIIDLGEIIALGSPNELKRKVRKTDVIELELQNITDQLAHSVKGLGLTKNVAVYITDPVTSSGVLRVHTHDARALIPGLIEQVHDSGAKIMFMRMSEPTLEDVFISLTGRKIRD